MLPITEYWWGLFSGNGALCAVEQTRKPLQEYAEGVWAVPWRTIRRRGDMYIQRVTVEWSTDD